MLTVDGTFLVILISFVLFMGFMKACFFEPIMQVKNEREKTIEAGRLASEEAAAKTLAQNHAYEQKMAEARRKAQHVVQEKRKWAKDQAATRLTNAREEAQSFLAQQSELLKQSQDTVYQSLLPQREELAKSIIAKLSQREKSPAGSSVP